MAVEAARAVEEFVAALVEFVEKCRVAFPESERLQQLQKQLQDDVTGWTTPRLKQLAAAKLLSTFLEWINPFAEYIGADDMGMINAVYRGCRNALWQKVCLGEIPKSDFEAQCEASSPAIFKRLDDEMCSLQHPDGTSKDAEDISIDEDNRKALWKYWRNACVKAFAAGCLRSGPSMGRAGQCYSRAKRLVAHPQPPQ